MSHFVFVETTRPGIQALEQAKRLGHAVTRLTSHQFDWLLRPEDHAALNEQFIVEELAQGPLYSIELAADGAGTWAALAIVRRKTGLHNTVLEMGSTVPSDLDDTQYEQAQRYAVEVAKALGLDLGIFHIEFIMTAEGPRLVEVNPRIAGGAIPDLVRTATGVNLFELLVRLYNGEPLAFKRLPSVAVASHTLLTVREDCVVRGDLAPDWFERFLPRLHSGHADIRPGQALRRMDGNYEVYGVVRVVAPSYEQAVAECEGLRRDIEQTLRVPLVEVRN